MCVCVCVCVRVSSSSRLSVVWSLAFRLVVRGGPLSPVSWGCRRLAGFKFGTDVTAADSQVHFGDGGRWPALAPASLKCVCVLASEDVCYVGRIGPIAVIGNVSNLVPLQN